MANLNTMSKEQLIKLLETQQQIQSSGLMVKLNEKQTHIYIRSESFKEYSVAKDKFYTAGINIPVNTAKVLFNDSNLLDLIKTQVNSITNNA